MVRCAFAQLVRPGALFILGILHHVAEISARLCMPEPVRRIGAIKLARRLARRCGAGAADRLKLPDARRRRIRDRCIDRSAANFQLHSRLAGI